MGELIAFVRVLHLFAIKKILRGCPSVVEKETENATLSVHPAYG